MGAQLQGLWPWDVRDIGGEGAEVCRAGLPCMRPIEGLPGAALQRRLLGSSRGWTGALPWHPENPPSGDV